MKEWRADQARKSQGERVGLGVGATPWRAGRGRAGSSVECSSVERGPASWGVGAPPASTPLASPPSRYSPTRQKCPPEPQSGTCPLACIVVQALRGSVLGSAEQGVVGQLTHGLQGVGSNRQATSAHAGRPRQHRQAGEQEMPGLHMETAREQAQVDTPAVSGGSWRLV